MLYYLEKYNNYTEDNRLTNFDVFDLHNLRHSDSSIYRSLELILGSKIGGEKYIHNYNKYNITNVQVPETSFEFKGDNLKSLSIKDRRYSFLGVMDTLYDKTESTYIYEVLASETKEFNKIRIPVYIDDGNTESVTKEDYIKAILNLDIEINYLQRKNVQRPELLNYDANVYMNSGDKDYNQVARRVLDDDTRNKKQIFQEPYMFIGYNNGMPGGAIGTKGALMTMWGGDTTDHRAGTYSVFTRHRNSRGNHSYKTKVSFFNTTDGTLKEVEKLLAIKKLIFNSKQQLEAVKYEPERINLVTSQDMIWGITKGMVGSSSSSGSYGGGTISSQYAMTYIQNFPTVYIGFEEENKLDVYLDREKTIVDTDGLKRVGFITVTFGNFKELGLHPTQYNKGDMYCRTSYDYSDNARFNIKISVPKGLPNLIYKGQMVTGSPIYLMPGYIEYDNDKFVTAELGMGPERPFHENDDIKYLNINSEFDHSRTLLMSQIDGTKVNDKNKVMELFKKVTRNMISPLPINKQWRSDNTLYLDGVYVRNFGGWILPPMRLAALENTQSRWNTTYTYNTQDEYKVGYGLAYNNENFYNRIINFSKVSDIYKVITGKNNKYAKYNIPFNYMCAREYIGLNPIYKRIKHDSPHPTNDLDSHDGAL